MTDIEKMHDLISELNKASEAYYGSGTTIMDDYTWDSKFDELTKLENEAGVVLSNSPTRNVSYDDTALSRGKKVKHKYPALSLPKTKKAVDLQKFAMNRETICSYKLDGLSLISVYDNGKLQRLESRGNGIEGLDITYLASAIHGLPVTIPYKKEVIIRGECLISYDFFDRYTREHGNIASNPRNLASGSLNLKDVDEAKTRGLHYIVYTLVHNADDGTGNDDELWLWDERAEFMKKNGFNIVPYEIVKPIDIPQTVKKWENMVKIYNYPCDGLVFCYRNKKYIDENLYNLHDNPTLGKALKFYDEGKLTTLTGIDYQVSTNSINPVAVFNSLNFDGANVTRASLVNLSEMDRLNLGGVGSKIRVIRANMVIPKVTECVERVGDPPIPDKCPICGAPTEIQVSPNGTKKLVCTSSSCPGKKLATFTRFVSKPGLNIDGISEKTVEDFINKGWITEYSDFFKLSSHRVEMSGMDGYGAKSVRKILDSVEKARHCNPDNFLFSLNVPMLGHDMVKKLLSNYSFSDLLTKLLSGTARRTDFSKIDGIGDEKSYALIKWFNNADNNMVVRRLLKEVEVKDPQKQSGGSKCANMTFCITGAVHIFKNRDAFKAYVESQGGKVSGSVSKKLTALVNNDSTSTSSKNMKAHELNIPIITEDEFIERFGYED